MIVKQSDAVSERVREGGIGLKFEVTDLRFVDPPDCKDGLDGPRDLDTRRRFNRFLMGALRQGWRMKRHPLQTEHDLRPLISSIPRLPMSDLISRVIDVVEDRHRRIVDIDCDTNSLVCHDLLLLLVYADELNRPITRMWPMPNMMAALPNIGGAVCESPVIPFIVRHRKVWLRSAAGVPCGNAANIGERKT